MKRKPTTAIVSQKPTPAQVRVAKYLQRIQKEIDDACGIPGYMYGVGTSKPTVTAWIDEAPLSYKDYKKMMRNARHKAKVMKRVGAVLLADKTKHAEAWIKDLVAEKPTAKGKK
jgi:hypothetical protein